MNLEIFKKAEKFYTHRIKENEYLKSINILALGLLISQALGFMVSMVQARVYSPENFGIFAILLAYVTFLAPLASGKIEVSVVIADKSQERNDLFQLCILYCIVASIFIGLFLKILSKYISQVENLGGYIYLVPVFILIISIFELLKSYCYSIKKYKIVSIGNVVNIISVGALSVTFGITGYLSLGLIMSYLISMIISCLTILILIKKEISSIKILRINKIKALLWRYKRYPLHNSPASMANGFMASLPLFIIAEYFSDSIVGYYSLILKVAFSPLGFISQSISQVNLKKVSELLSDEKEIHKYITKITKFLVIILLLPTIALTIYAPEIISYVFGIKWVEAGYLMRYLMPSFAVQMIVSTLSTSLIAVGHLRLQAIWQYSSFIFMSLILFYAASYNNVDKFFILLSIAIFVSYFMYYILIIYAVKNPIIWK